MKARKRIIQLIKRTPTDFVDAIADQVADAKKSVTMVGKVTATSPLNVRAFDVDYGALPKLGSYTPAVNDVVLVLVDAQQATILGKLS